MSLMTGMTPRDPMGGMSMPGWHIMDMGVVKVIYNRQGGPSGKQDFESLNWNMLHASRTVGPGRLSLMLMNSLQPVTFLKRGHNMLFVMTTKFVFHGCYWILKAT